MKQVITRSFLLFKLCVPRLEYFIPNMLSLQCSKDLDPWSIRCGCGAGAGADAEFQKSKRRDFDGTISTGERFHHQCQ